MTPSPPSRRLADWDADRLCELADQHETPLYLYDIQRVKANYHRLATAFPETAIHYAAKANTTGRILRALHDCGAGIECVSAGELYRTREAGIPGRDLLYTAVNPPADDLDFAVDIPELTITAGAEDTIDRLADRGFDGRLCLRVNPGIEAGHHEHVRTGANPKFGIPADRLPALLESAADRGFDVVGIHAHAGSGISEADLSAHRELVARMGTLAREAPVSLEFVDIGGGFGVPYHPEDTPLDLDAVATATREAIGELDAHLAIEPGRYCVADAGVLLTRVNTIKDAGGTTVIGVDAGMNTLLRPALYDAYHEIQNLSATPATRDDTRVTVTGPICESADVFGTDRELASPARGDVLGIGTAGAYGFEMASQYNSRPRPGIVTIEDETTSVVRERETHRDLLHGERHPA